MSFQLQILVPYSLFFFFLHQGLRNGFSHLGLRKVPNGPNSNVCKVDFCRLEGKVALVTGAAAGIGETITRLFVSHGAKVIIADIQDELGQSLSNELGEQSAVYVHCDVTEEIDIENAVNKAITLFEKLDIMVNNVGTQGPPIVKILDTKKSDFEKVVNTNLVGAFLGTKHAARVMIPNQSGVIISTGSAAAVMAGAAGYAYTSSKHGIVGLVKSAAVELKEYGIRVNCVSPWAVTTPMLRGVMNMDDEGAREFFEKLRLPALSPDDVAQAVVFMASDESKFMNGHNLVIDGGYTIENRAFSVYGKPTWNF